VEVLIAGDSHMGSLKLGVDLIKEGGHWPEGLNLTLRPLGSGAYLETPFFINKGDYAEICEPAYRQRYKRFPPAEDNEGVIYGLCFALDTAIWRHRDWSRYIPSTLAREHGSPVSEALLHHVIVRKIEYVI
jgi:hypothetical protein